MRLKHPDKRVAVVKDYTKRAKVRIVHRAAATAWVEGVPWAEALTIAGRAMANADGAMRKIQFPAGGKGVAKGRGKGKSKGLAKGKAGAK